VDTNEVYTDDFERPFLETSGEFYALESQQFLMENDASVYLKKGEKRLKEEELRVDHYLDPSTKEKIQRIVERELIFNPMRRVLEVWLALRRLLPLSSVYFICAFLFIFVYYYYF